MAKTLQLTHNRKTSYAKKVSTAVYMMADGLPQAERKLAAEMIRAGKWSEAQEAFFSGYEGLYRSYFDEFAEAVISESAELPTPVDSLPVICLWAIPYADFLLQETNCGKEQGAPRLAFFDETGRPISVGSGQRTKAQKEAIRRALLAGWPVPDEALKVCCPELRRTFTCQTEGGMNGLKLKIKTASGRAALISYDKKDDVWYRENAANRRAGKAEDVFSDFVEDFEVANPWREYARDQLKTRFAGSVKELIRKGSCDPFWRPLKKYDSTDKSGAAAHWEWNVIDPFHYSPVKLHAWDGLVKI